MTEIVRRLIPWEPSVDGGSLGRHVHHDPRSRNFRVTRAVTPLRSVKHRRRVPPYDQSSIIDLGSCVVHAGRGVQSTAPFRHRITSERRMIRDYKHLTAVDDVPGQYPPDDTGSDGLAFAKMVLAEGSVSRYEHAFGIEDHLHGLQSVPGMVGTDWLDGMDCPDPDGRVHPVGSLRGAHEYECAEYEQRGTVRNDAEDRLWFWQSWGQWALGGRFWMTVTDFAGLLARQGDSTFLVP